ncbi:hypothetical protein BJF85_18795 [Saccharomonospora sp. CUA-673]|nr:hypothetical protein BJF85_18795 [Saccharomonospora sp. CUA-673]
MDPTTPSVARVYDAFLGGTDHYASDVAVFEQVNAVAPQMADLARSTRDWLVRAVRYLAGTAGMDQFLDLGAGLPSAENTHQVAQRYNGDARVAYVDIDPVVAAHGRALLEENQQTRLVQADLTRPDDIWAHPEISGFLELDQPLVLMQSGTIHHVPDSEGPQEIMERYIELLPSGSYIAFMHFHDPEDDGPGTELARFVEQVFAQGDMGSGFFRTREQLTRFLHGTELLDPGLVRLEDWWPNGPHLQPLTVADQVALAGVARKP